MTTKTSAVNVQVNSEDKEQAINILDDLGMNMSTFINLAIKQLIKHERIPFEISNPKPKRDLLDALLEASELKKRINNGENIGCNNMNDLISRLNDEWFQM